MANRKKQPDPARADWPRERLIEKGLDSLSIADLVAIVFNTGYGKESVRDLARRLLREYGSNGLKDMRKLTDIRSETGLPEVKACQLIACFELGRRLFDQQPRGSNAVVIRSPRDVFEHLAEMRSLRKEQLCGLYLNARNRVIRQETISIGTMTANLVDPKEVLRPALEFSAVGVIVAHNHPSGNPEPSDEDITITAQLAKAAGVLDVKLLDHVIVAEGGFRSMNEMGLL